MTVLDINDNAPIFATDYETLLCENTTPGQVRPSPPLCWGGVLSTSSYVRVFSSWGGSVEAPDTSQGPGSVRRCCSLAAPLSSSCVRAELMTMLLSACGSDPLWHHGIPPWSSDAVRGAGKTLQESKQRFSSFCGGFADLI